MAGQKRLEKGQYRAYIVTRAKLNLKATTILDDLYADTIFFDTRGTVTQIPTPCACEPERYL